jgi:hypothetical protein
VRLIVNWDFRKNMRDFLILSFVYRIIAVFITQPVITQKLQATMFEAKV